MNRRTFIVASGAMLIAVPLPLRAQTSGNVKKIGVLGVSRATANTQPIIDALSELGWTAGRDVAYEYRWSDQRNDRLPELAADLVRSNVEVIVVVSGATGTKAAKDASNKVPIVMIMVADPVKFGLIATFAHPGGNVTGLAQPLVDWGKWLELARESVPGLKQIAVIANSTNIVYADYVAQNEAAARRLGIQLRMFPVAQAEDFAGAFAAMKRESVGALVVGPDTLFNSNIPKIIALAAAHQLPVIAANRRYAELGAMISYGTDFNYVFRRAASYVDKILRGVKPSDLPVEQPDRFELVVNLKTARELGLTIPQPLLLRATEVIQ